MCVGIGDPTTGTIGVFVVVFGADVVVTIFTVFGLAVPVGVGDPALVVWVDPPLVDVGEELVDVGEELVGVGEELVGAAGAVVVAAGVDGATVAVVV